MCDEATKSNLELVQIKHSNVLGNTYEAIAESLNYPADAKFSLSSMPREERDS